MILVFKRRPAEMMKLDLELMLGEAFLHYSAAVRPAVSVRPTAGTTNVSSALRLRPARVRHDARRRRRSAAMIASCVATSREKFRALCFRGPPAAEPASHQGGRVTMEADDRGRRESAARFPPPSTSIARL
jgi:hypothetical protein